MAPTYRSFPLDLVRKAVAGCSVAVIGAVGDALRRSLPDAAAVVVSRWPPMAPAPEAHADHLLDRLRRCGRIDWLVMTDPDAGQLLLDHPDILFEARQATRRSALLTFEPDRCRFWIGELHGFSLPEEAAHGRWRWIASTDGTADIEIWSAADAVAMLHFATAFCSPATAEGRTHAELTIRSAKVTDRRTITAGERVSVPLSLIAGRNRITIATDIPPVPDARDGRTLSLALLDPELCDGASIVVGPAAFLAGGGDPAAGVRTRLHAAGFEAVTPFVCGAGAAPTQRALATSVSDPLRLKLAGGLGETRGDGGGIGGDGEVTWWLCGERP